MTKQVDQMLDFFLTEKGETVIHNGFEKVALITDVTDHINYFNDKYIRSDFELHAGDVIEYQGNTYILMSQVNKDHHSYHGKLRKVNYRIKIVVNESVHEFDTVISSKTFGMTTDKYMTIEEGKIEVLLPSSFVSEQIVEAMRFIKMGSAWMITGVDQTQVGLIRLTCEKDQFGTYDDRENEIADTDKIASYTIEINEMNAEVEIGATFQYTATIYRNGTEDTSKTVEWSVSNENATISNTGLVEAISVGTLDIIAAVRKKPEVSTSLPIEVIEATPTEVITYKVWSSNTDGTVKSYTNFDLTYGSTKWFGVDKFVDGNLASTNDTYTFSLDPNGTPTSAYTYTVVDQQKVELKADDYTYSVILNAASNETGETMSQTIQLNSLW